MTDGGHLHLGSPFSLRIGVDFSESYPVVAWLAWVPNLILTEWYLALFETNR